MHDVRKIMYPLRPSSVRAKFWIISGGSALAGVLWSLVQLCGAVAHSPSIEPVAKAPVAPWESHIELAQMAPGVWSYRYSAEPIACTDRLAIWACLREGGGATE